MRPFNTATIEERMIAVEVQLEHLIELAESTDDRTDKLERVIWQAVAIAAVIIVIVNVAVPFALRFLPT